MNSDDQSLATASIKFFEAAFDQDIMGLAICSADPKSLRWGRVNRKFCDILGYSQDELLQMTVLNITLPEEHMSVVEFSEKLFQREVSSHSCEKRCVRKDGSTVWVEIGLFPIETEDVEIEEIVCFIQDISERKST